MLILGATVGAVMFGLVGSSSSGASATCDKTFAVSSGSWQTAGNWMPSGVPTSTQYACIPAARTATLSAARTVRGVEVLGGLDVTAAGALTLNDPATTSPSVLSGVIAGNGTVTQSAGTLAVAGGSMGGAGTTTVAVGATMTVTSASNPGLWLNDDRTLVNNGTVTVTGTDSGSAGYVYLTSLTASVTNNGLLELRDGADVTGSGLLRVGPAGLVRSTTAGDSTISTLVELAGKIEPTLGTITVATTVTPASGGSTTGVLSTNGGTLLVETTVDIGSGSRISTTGTGVALTGNANVQGDGELRVSAGTLAVTGAQMGGNGTTTISTGATMTVTSPSNPGLWINDSRTVVNNGTITVTGTDSGSAGYLYLTSGTAAVTNNGLLELRGDADITGSGTLTNTATATTTKPTGNGVSTVSVVAVENDGVMSSTSGTLDVNGSGTPGPSSGSFAATSTATTVVGGVLLADAELVGPASGTGSVILNGNTVTVPSGAVVTAIGQTALDGTLSGDGQLVVSTGTLAVAGGSMGGAGTTTVAVGATMTVTSASNPGLWLNDDRTLVNNGTVTVTGTDSGSAGYVYLTSLTASVTNNGLLELRDGADVTGSGLLRVGPAGLVRSTTAGDSTISTLVELAGKIEPTLGTITVATTVTPASGGSTTGVLSTNGGTLLVETTVDIGSGSRISTTGTGVALTGNANVQGDGELRVSAGTLAVTGAQMGGNGTTTISTGATMTVTSPSNPGLWINDSRTVVNNGTITVTGTDSGSAGYLYLTSGTAAVTNNGLLELRGDADITGSGTLTNTATATTTKPTGNGVSTVSVATDNDGTVQVLNGRLEFTGAFSALSGTTLTKGTYRVVSPGVMRLPSNVNTNQATIVLEGVNAKLERADGANGLAAMGVNSGSLTVKGGKQLTVGALSNTGTLEIGPVSTSKVQTSSFVQTAGTTTLRDATSTLAATGTATVSGGIVRGLGTVQAGAAGLVVNGTGRVEPGISGPGTLAVTGNAVFSAGGRLAVDVDGTAAGQTDRLVVTGSATLGGILDLDTGYAAALPDDLTVITCGGTCTGSFTTVLGAELPGFLSWHVERFATTVHVRVVQPVVTVSDASIAEPDTGTTPMFTITLSEPTSAAQTITVVTTDGTATSSGSGVADHDFDAVSTTMTFAPEQTALARVNVVGDFIYEHDESLTVAVTSTDLVIGDGAATGTIQNDEPVPVLSVGVADVVEGDAGNAALPLTAELSVLSSFESSASWATADCTATAGSDYTATGGTVTIAAGSASVALAPTPQALGDLVTEADETFSVDFSNATPPGDLVLADPGCNLTIEDDDAAISVQAGSATESDSGTTPLTFTVSLSHANPRPVTFSWSTSAGTAAPGSDYVQVTGAAGTVPAGFTSANLSVDVVGDLASEPTETFTVTLSGVSGGQPGTPMSATMTILDDDGSVAPCTLTGTAGNDTISGTSGNDVYCGLGGNDTFLYSAGDDTFWGGALGAETGGGNDTIVYTGFGGGFVDAQLATGQILLKSPPGNLLATHAEHAVENITGSPGDDFLHGDNGVNKIKGGAGNDTVSGYNGNDDLDGGDGKKDIATYFNAAGPVTVTMTSSSGSAGNDAMTRIEHLIGSEFNDTLTGDAGVNTLSGLAGDDVINTGSGNDTAIGHGGADTINTGPGDDTIYGDSPNDVHGTDGPDNVHGDIGNDKLFGMGGNDSLYGDDGKDVIHGDDGKDTFLDGGPGDYDKVYGDAGTETVASISGGAGIHDNCKQGGTSDPAGLPGPGCENDVAEPTEQPPAEAPTADGVSGAAVRED